MSGDEAKQTQLAEAIETNFISAFEHLTTMHACLKKLCVQHCGENESTGYGELGMGSICHIVCEILFMYCSEH